MSQVIFCTVDLPLARVIAWLTRGYGHAALVSSKQPGKWLDARGSGVAYREPEAGLHRFETVDLPFDIEEAALKHLGEVYNYRGIWAFLFHFYWHAKGVFCSQSIFEWCRESGHPIVDPVYEDQISPGEGCRLLKAYVRGLQWTA